MADRDSIVLFKKLQRMLMDLLAATTGVVDRNRDLGARCGEPPYVIGLAPGLV